jgi:TatD DNase family protein
VAEDHTRLVHAAVGFHPHEAGKVTDESFAAMFELWSHPKVVAVGEMGLDYHYDFADRDTQREVFARQLAEAAKRRLPVVIHSREALDDTVRILIEQGFAGRPVVFHCFTGTAEEAQRIAEHGWRVSFTGVVTFKKSDELRRIARAYPLEKLMVETDAPYLSPEPVRNKRPNEPAFVAHTARFLAELRDEPYEAFAEQTARNTREFFRLGRG